MREAEGQQVRHVGITSRRGRRRVSKERRKIREGRREAEECVPGITDRSLEVAQSDAVYGETRLAA